MAVSYKKLWKLLIDKDMKKSDLLNTAGISRYTIGSIINGRTDGLSKQTINKIDAYLAKER